MICPKCNNANPEGSKFCIYCGFSLSAGTKICPNGHIYDSIYDKCPICPSPELAEKIGSTFHSSPTVPNLDSFNDFSDKTVIDQSSESGSSGKKTVIVGAQDNELGQERIMQSRKIVGWLVSFSIRPEGIDYKLYEGRNLVTGSGQGDIIIPDPAVSSPHCMILYRSGKFKIKDELSTNGTYVNGVEIEETELNDGDIIKIGTTELKLRTVN